jgi:hypothetical protein
VCAAGLIKRMATLLALQPDGAEMLIAAGGIARAGTEALVHVRWEMLLRLAGAQPGGGLQGCNETYSLESLHARGHAVGRYTVHWDTPANSLQMRSLGNPCQPYMLSQCSQSPQHQLASQQPLPLDSPRD